MKLPYRMLIALLLALPLAVVVFAQDSSSTAAPLAAGDPIVLQGQVLDSDGAPIAGAVVEIWQTDANGNYDHPNDSDPSVLLADFQYFGTSTTDADGNYAFRTVKPGQYEPRPAHIHVKVKLDGATLLTTQFYFPEDMAAVEADGVFGDAGDSLFVQPTELTDADNTPVVTNNLVIDRNGSAADAVAPTPDQTEGPYYPVVDFSGYDNNLTSTAADDAIITPVLEQVAATFTLLDLNSASGDAFLTIPDMSSRMVREFNEYRPYISIAQFRREIGKYVSDEQVAAYEQYVYVPIDVNASDAETLKQIPGLDDAAAEALIGARPFESNAAFLTALSDYLPAAGVSLAANYLAAGA
ncbi:MAG: carboxypeptidase regulatory-like domain-containing protein [Anaerolineae bacterium]|nr:carboxypeptidase regulatory-like domain-containing protein [Anaerolineae bacterium]